MKLISLILFTCCFSICHAQNNALIEQIEKKCTDIGNSARSFDSKVVTDNRAGKSGDITGYYSANKLQMIIAEYFGTTDKMHIEYYFDSGEVIFVYSEDTIKSGAAQGKNEVNAWYWHDGKLISWIKSDEQIKTGSKEFLKSEEEQLKEIKRLVRLLK